MPKAFYVCPECGGTLATRYKEEPPVVTCLDKHKVEMEYCGDWPDGLEKMRELRLKIRRCASLSATEQGEPE